MHTNVPIISTADPSWKVCLVDNPGFGEALQEDMMEKTKIGLATSSAYVYLVSYSHIGDATDAESFRCIYKQEKDMGN